MFGSIIGNSLRKRSLRLGRTGCVIATGVFILGLTSNAHAWWMDYGGIYDDQGNWVPGVPATWPADVNGVHVIPVCWEAPTQAEIDLVYPPPPGSPPGTHTLLATPQAEAATWIQLARRYVENTWARASNIVFSGWGPCSYNLYTEYTQEVRNDNTDLVLLQNGVQVHPERHGLHVELIQAATGTSTFYRGKHGIVRSRMPLDPNTNIKLPWAAVHEFGHSLGFWDEEVRSDYCNSYIADGGDTALDDHCLWAVPLLPLPAQPGPGLSPTADAHTIMAYYKAPPHQFYWGPGPRSESVAEMGTLLSTTDVYAIQGYYGGRPPAGTIKGYRGRELSGPDGWWGAGPVLASLPGNPTRGLWTTEAVESSICPGASMTPLEVPTLDDVPGAQLQVRPPNGGANQRSTQRLARWRAWGNMCLWAQSLNEGSPIILDYCTATLNTEQQNPLYFSSRLYWVEHYQVGNNFQYRLANTNLCAAVADASYSGEPLVLRNCDMGDDLQLFMKNDVGQLVPRAIAAGSRDKCLNVLGGQHQPGEALGLWNCNVGVPSPNEQFFLTEQLQFGSNEECMDILNADTSLDPAGDPSANVGLSRCKGTADAFAWNSTQIWDVYGGGTLTPASRPSLGAGSGNANLGAGLTERVGGTQFTLEMWVNPSASQSTYANIIDFNHRANIGMVVQQDGSTTNRYAFAMGNGTTSCGVVQQLQPNRWQHVHLVRSGSTLDLYVDGTRVQTTNSCFSDNVYYLPNSSVTVAYNANYGRPFAGRYAGIRLWNNLHLPASIEPADPDANLSFNGSTDGMSLGNGLPGTMQGDFTIELLVNPAATQQTYADILDFNHRANVGLVIQQNGNTTNQFSFAVGNGSTSAGVSAQLTANRWQSLAFVRRGAQLSLYVDGALASQASCFSGNISFIQGSNVTVGYNANYGRYFNGQIKVVRMSRFAKTF